MISVGNLFRWTIIIGLWIVVTTQLWGIAWFWAVIWVIPGFIIVRSLVGLAMLPLDNYVGRLKDKIRAEEGGAPVANITIKREGSFWLVLADSVPLGHAYKLLAFEGDPAWRSALRLIFRPLWRASASSADADAPYVHLEEVHGVFHSRAEAIGSILAYHGVEDSRYPTPSHPS